MAVIAYIRKTGSDNNGGSSSGTSPDKTGSTGVANGTTTFTDAGATWTAGDVGKLINIVGKGLYQITARASNTSITLSGSPPAASGLTWNIGGARLTVNGILSNANNCLCQAGSNDTIYIGAGRYDEVCTVSLTPGSTNTLTITADVDGSQTGDPGQVRLTGWTSGSTTAPSNSALIAFGTKTFITINKLIMVSGGTSSMLSMSAAAPNITFNDCTMVCVSSNTNAILSYSATAGTTSNLLFNRCRIKNAQGTRAFLFSLPTLTGADYNSGITFLNCMVDVIGGFATVTSSGASANAGGGFTVNGCTIVSGATAISSLTTHLSTTIPCLVYNSEIWALSAINAAVLGQITQGHNLIYANTTLTNVTGGGSSITDDSYAPFMHLGDERVSQQISEPYMAPTTDSPILGFGNENVTVTAPTVDLLNQPRPSGGGSSSNAVGCLESHVFAVKETTTVDVSPSIKMAGPGSQDFRIPVPSGSSTITIKVQRDGSYGAGTKPQITITEGGEIGVADQTVTDAGSASVWNTLTANITSTAAGIITIRLDCSGSASAGTTYWDTASCPVLADGTQSFAYFRGGQPAPFLTHDASFIGSRHRKLICYQSPRAPRRPPILIPGTSTVISVPLSLPPRRIVYPPRYIRGRNRIAAILPAPPVIVPVRIPPRQIIRSIPYRRNAYNAILSAIVVNQTTLIKSVRAVR